ncbi:hypothetical protein ACF8EA_17485 [Pseudomonas sp. YQ_5]|uniref:hypothetical protein n=1 Tax=Pseudomonas sp. YQ_5 TaxID=3367229 RepID=UPI00370C8ED8
MEVRTPAITGDIILMCRPAKNSNLIAQSIFRQARARHSHVSIVLSEFSFMDAMRDSGVQVQSLASYLNENRDFQVYRNNQLLVGGKLGQLRENLQFYSRQKYSLRGILFPTWRHSFCSELAAKAYDGTGVKLTTKNRNPRHVLPVDIYKHISTSPDWVEVTQEYKDAFFDSDHLSLLDDASKIDRFNVDLTQQMGFSQQAFSDLAYRATQHSDEPLVIEPNMRYWSNPLAGKVSIIWRVGFTLKYWARMIAELAVLLWVRLFKR